MAIVPIVIPRTGGLNTITGAVTWERTCLPSLESNPGADGFGCTTALFGYLADIWARTCHNLSRVVDEPIDLVDSGFYQNPDTTFPWLHSVRIDFFPPPPTYSDLLYGEVPIYYLGMMGWGFSPGVSGQFSAGPIRLSGGVTFSEPYKLAPIFINHLKNEVRAPQAGLNAFWWHLKKGVRGVMTPHVIDYGFGATANPEGAAQTYQPSYGGWCPSPPSPFGQVFDGCGQPACK